MSEAEAVCGFGESSGTTNDHIRFVTVKKDFNPLA